MKVEEIIERFEMAKKTRVGTWPNCVGTALYACGALKEDNCFDPLYANKLLARRILKEQTRYNIGDLVFWGCEQYASGVLQGFDVFHAAVVTQLSPLLVSQREEVGGKIMINVPIKVPDKVYLLGENEWKFGDIGGKTKWVRRFYVPENLNGRKI